MRPGPRAAGATACLLLVASATASAADVGRRVYEAEVSPALVVNGCPLCHAIGYVYPAFRYEDFRRFLAIGRSADDNYLVRKVSDPGLPGPVARPAHMGGVRCRPGDDAVCRALARWWNAEFGAVR